jgi:hypothetical protein
METVLAWREKKTVLDYFKEKVGLGIGVSCVQQSTSQGITVIPQF